MLPGTVRAADRFARALNYISACQQSADAREAVAPVILKVNSGTVANSVCVNFLSALQL